MNVLSYRQGHFEVFELIRKRKLHASLVGNLMTLMKLGSEVLNKISNNYSFSALGSHSAIAPKQNKPTELQIFSLYLKKMITLIIVDTVPARRG